MNKKSNKDIIKTFLFSTNTSNNAYLSEVGCPNT